MSAPLIFNGKFSKLLTQRAVIRSDGGILEYDGPRNYIANSHFEQGVSGWSLLTTTLTSGLPTGSLTLSAASLSALATTSTTPLAGSQSLQVAAGTAWTAGQGIISTAFTVDRKDLGKVLTFKFYYEAITGSTLINWSGILGSQSLGVYIYDTTASAWLQPAGFLGMNQGTGQGYVTGTFQTSVTAGQQYQIALIALQAPTAGAISLNIDEVYLGPQTAPIGAVISDPVTFTPTGSFLANCTYSGYWWREGRFMNVDMAIAFTGATTSTTLTVNLPTGYSVDTTYLVRSGNNQEVVGIGQGVLAASNHNLQVNYNGSNTFVVLIQTNTAGGQSNLTQSNGGVIQNADSIQLTYRVPIVGWAATTLMSSDSDTRVVAFRASQSTTPTGTINSSNNNITWGATPASDTHGGFNGSTTYTIPISGYYNIAAQASIDATYAAGNVGSISIAKNGTRISTNQLTAGSSSVGTLQPTATISSVLCSAGDTITVQSRNFGTSPIFTSNTDFYFFTVMRCSGPAVIAATESVSCSYTTSVTSVPNTTFTTVVYTAKEWDSHNAYSTSTGLFSVPVSGKYMVIGSIEFASSVAAQLLYVYKNGSNYKRIFQNQSASQSVSQGSAMVFANAGDTLNITAYQAQGSTVAMSGTPTDTFVSIVRIGN